VILAASYQLRASRRLLTTHNSPLTVSTHGFSCHLPVPSFQKDSHYSLLISHCSLLTVSYHDCLFPVVKTPDNNIGRAYGTEINSSAIGTVDLVPPDFNPAKSNA